MTPMTPTPNLHELTEQAKALAQGDSMATGSATDEVARVLQICNACRYCEGFCAVFPAMTRRLSFPAADVHYLANLCHNCSACLHACQYAPPHEFQVNVPRAMARVRVRTYAEHAWPSAFGVLYGRNGLVVSMALALGLTTLLLLVLWRYGSLWQVPPEGHFYGVLPHGWMVGLFAPVFAFALLALALGVRRFWRAQRPGPASASASAEAAGHALTLKYLDGGHGQGCNNADDAFTLARRRAHHATFYGFMLCFAATSVATLYHYVFGWSAPYAWTSLPKVLGTSGGVLLCLGTTAQAWLARRRHESTKDLAAAGMDVGLIALLFIVSASGLAMAAAHHTPALPLLLAIHLGAVLAFFLTLPYGKFAHGAYRAAALLLWSIEKRQPAQVNLGTD